MAVSLPHERALRGRDEDSVESRAVKLAAVGQAATMYGRGSGAASCAVTFGAIYRKLMSSNVQTHRLACTTVPLLRSSKNLSRSYERKSNCRSKGLMRGNDHSGLTCFAHEKAYTGAKLLSL